MTVDYCKISKVWSTMATTISDGILAFTALSEPQSKYLEIPLYIGMKYNSCL